MNECRKCGAELVEDAVFCHKCGAPVEDAEIEEKKGRRNGVIITLLIILISVVLLDMTIKVGEMLGSRSDAMRESVEQRDLAAQKNTPVPTEAAEGGNAAEKLKATFPPGTDLKYHDPDPVYVPFHCSDPIFSCSYPKSFEVYIEKDPNCKYALRNGDGSVTMKICAEKNSAVTVQQSKAAFIGGSTGEITNSRGGDTYYTVQINENGISRYRYLVSKNGNFYWFDLSFPYAYRAVYEEYAQRIYNSFNIK